MADNLDLLSKGIAEFNRQEFFLCHETLEELWMDYKGEDREAIQGIIQIAVGYYHLLRGNEIGALKLFERGGNRVEKFAPVWVGFDLSALLQEVNKLKKILQSINAGAAKDSLDNLQFPIIRQIDGSNDCSFPDKGLLSK